MGIVVHALKFLQRFKVKEDLRYLGTYAKIFDRSVKRRQRNWSVNCKDYDVCQYIKEEVGYQIADKICDLKKFSEICISLGSDGGHIIKHISKEKIGIFIECDMSEELIQKSSGVSEAKVPCFSVIADEEQVPFKDGCADVVVSNLTGHWINDLSGWFHRCFAILREDCPMIGAVLAGDTLQELRISLQLAESERLGGVGAHISPFLFPADVGSLMHRAGFKMITLDSDRIEKWNYYGADIISRNVQVFFLFLVGYPNIFALMYDLQSMGESNASKHRMCHIRRDILIAADAIYKTMFSGKKRGYPATFHVISFIGWKPGPTLPEPVKRGSQKFSFKDLSRIVSGEIVLPNSDDAKLN